MPNVISTKISRDNSNNVTYVLKKYDNNTVTVFTYMLIKGCYRLIYTRNTPCIT